MYLVSCKLAYAFISFNTFLVDLLEFSEYKIMLFMIEIVSFLPCQKRQCYGHVSFNFFSRKDLVKIDLNPAL